MISNTKNKKLTFPVFFPDATHGVIKSMENSLLTSTNTPGVVVNAYHLMVDGVVDLIQQNGGIHKFMNYNGTILSDSGGFQVMSIVRRTPGNGKITENGVKFKLEGKGTLMFSPELSIQTQIKIKSDIVMCFDDCTEPFEPVKQQRLSIKRTIDWAARCKSTFKELTNDIDPKERPKLFGIIQGGEDPNLRRECGEKLAELDFDGYAFGGWPVNQDKILMEDILSLTAGLMPDGKPKYAMGVGKPDDIVKCFKMGYSMFDCVLPTRDARHKRLYVFDAAPSKDYIMNSDKFYEYVHIGSGRYSNDMKPVSVYCDCPTCQNYSRAYLNHLFKCEPNVAATLATIHNIRFYAQLMEFLQSK